MARLLTSGAESKDLPATGTGIEQVSLVGTNAPTFDAVARSGNVSWKFDTGAGNSAASCLFLFTGAHGTDYFLRVYVRFPAFPSAAGRIPFARIYEISPLPALCIDSSGVPYFDSNGGSGTILWTGSALSIDTWYQFEIRGRSSASASSTQLEVRFQGSSVFSTSTFNNTNTFTRVNFGWLSAPGANKVIYVDDVAFNDSSGSAQNSWPGSGKQVLLLPTANSSIGNWLSGSGTSGTNDGNQWDAVNNTPPVGTTSPDATTACISNKVSGAGGAGNGDFTMATYTAAGVTAGSTINCVQQWIAHGEDASTNTKTGTFNIVSNPSSGTPDNVAEGGSNQFGPAAGGAVGTYNTNWVPQGGTIVYAPSVTLGTAPVARITKTDTGTRAADCCFLGIYVDYTPSSGTLKTANTLARASIKTIDTLAIGSVKTYDGLTP